MVNLLVTSLLVVLADSSQVAEADQARESVIVVASSGEAAALPLKAGTRTIDLVQAIEGGNLKLRTASGIAMNVDRAQVSDRASVAHQAAAPPQAPETMRLSGPRVGATFLSDGIIAKLRADTDLTVGSVVTQFGWQFEKRFVGRENGLTAVTEWVFLLGGIDQGVVLPSLSWLVGLRTAKGVEFAIGPNLTPVGAAVALAAGVTLRSGRLNFPVNLAVVPSTSGVRVSLLAGFNARR